MQRKIAKIQYITQASTEEHILIEVEEVLKAGINWIQLRIKNKSLDFLTIAQKVKKITDQFQAVLLINDRVDVAAEINADGVHIGLTDMPIQEAREILGYEKIIGSTANTLTDIKNGELFGADYIGLGPYKYTSTKTNLSPVLGLKGYQELIPKAESYGWMILDVEIPIVAIGGLEIEDIELLSRHTGIHGIALSGLIFKAEQKKELVEKLKTIMPSDSAQDESSSLRRAQGKSS